MESLSIKMVVLSLFLIIQEELLYLNFKGYLNENELYLFMLEVVLEILNHNKVYFSAIEKFFNRRDNVFITDEQGITIECLSRLSKDFIE